jgi:hypothetical protein
MLLQRKSLKHPIGSSIDMPRLVPSFSSKGFPRIVVDKKRKKEISAVTYALEMTGPTISDSILISAYDIHHNYLRRPERYFGNKEMVIIDSGGYELSADYDSTEPKQPPYESKGNYDVEEYRKVLLKLSHKFPIIITNFDHGVKGMPIEEQIKDAQVLFNEFPKFLHDFIIRPSGKKNYLNMHELISHIEKMRLFHIIGVTEKELGNTILNRLINIANLRIAMNRSSIDVPIQIWGGLDPVVSPLYFCAGAEIFDGVSWLRYGYYSDACISRDAYTAIELGVQSQWRRAEAMRLAKNISYLETLTIRMRRFVDTGGRDFKVFETHANTIEHAYEALSTKVPELKGGV